MPEAVERELTFAQAIREALAEEMRRDDTVCILGEDVAEAGAGGDQELVEKNRKMLKLYQANKPYHQAPPRTKA